MTNSEQKNLAILSFFLFSFAMLAIVWNVYFSNALDEDYACPIEVKKCPDGSYITMGGPSCSYSACKPAEEKEAIQSQPQDNGNDQEIIAQNSPQNAVKSFYEWYLGLSSSQKKRQKFDKRTEITSAFTAKITSKDENNSKNYDQIICGAGVANNFNIESLYQTNGRAVVMASMALSANDEPQTQNIAIELVLSENSWKINDVFCRQQSNPVDAAVGAE